MRFSPCALALRRCRPRHCAAVAGRAAPAFTLTDTAGKTVQLADYKGKYVVLEWTNPECPFVRKHYGSGNMQALQKEWGAQRRRLAVDQLDQRRAAPNSRRRAQMAQWMQAQGAAPTATLLDGDQRHRPRVRARKTTPHMFVIDPAGKVVYAGAIDDKRSANPADAKIAQQLRARRADRGDGRQAGDRREHDAVRLQRQVLTRLALARRLFGAPDPFGGRGVRAEVARHRAVVARIADLPSRAGASASANACGDTPCRFRCANA